jgi:hypothetical protein
MMPGMAASDETGEGRRPVDTFGARLALMRQALGGWNIKRTADFCGVSDEAWRNWEAGRTLPRDYPGMCHRIAGRLDFDVAWVMMGGPLVAPSTKWYSAVAA